MISDAIQEVYASGEDVYIRCENLRMQETMRVSGFHARKRLINMVGGDADSISIQKVTVNGELCIRIFKRKNRMFKLEDGEFVEFKKEGGVTEEDRIVALMKADGKTEEEIQEFLKANGMGEEGEGEGNE